MYVLHLLLPSQVWLPWLPWGALLLRQQFHVPEGYSGDYLFVLSVHSSHSFCWLYHKNILDLCFYLRYDFHFIVFFPIIYPLSLLRSASTFLLKQSICLVLGRYLHYLWCTTLSPHNRTAVSLFFFCLCNWTTSVSLFAVQGLTQPNFWFLRHDSQEYHHQLHLLSRLCWGSEDSHTDQSLSACLCLVLLQQYLSMTRGVCSRGTTQSQ